MKEWKILSLDGKIRFRENHYSGIFFPVLGPFSQIFLTGKFRENDKLFTRKFKEFPSGKHQLLIFDKCSYVAN